MLFDRFHLQVLPLSLYCYLGFLEDLPFLVSCLKQRQSKPLHDPSLPRH